MMKMNGNTDSDMRMRVSEKNGVRAYDEDADVREQSKDPSQMPEG